jgi:hypothetical protein
MDDDSLHPGGSRSESDRSTLPIQVRMDNVEGTVSKHEPAKSHDIACIAQCAERWKEIQRTPEFPDLAIVCADALRVSEKMKLDFFAIDVAEDIHQKRLGAASIHHADRLQDFDFLSVPPHCRPDG